LKRANLIKLTGKPVSLETADLQAAGTNEAGKLIAAAGMFPVRN
jgi:hypothetical protein